MFCVQLTRDWARVQSLNNRWFPRNCRSYNEVFHIPWKEKKPTAVFRGASTGCGVTIETNPRLKIAYISATTKTKEGEFPLLDAGVTKWNTRPRKLGNSPYLQSIDVKSLGITLVSRLTLRDQSMYRYIVNVDGHVSAFRLSVELGNGFSNTPRRISVENYGTQICLFLMSITCLSKPIFQTYCLR